MKLLLPAIKTALHSHSIVTTDSDIYITPDVRWRPEGTGDTCIGIKDGGLHREELAGEVWEITATVELAAFAPLTTNGSDSLCGNSGCYAILDAAVALLVNNLLSITGAQSVEIGDDTPSGIVQVQDETMLVTLTRKLTYTIELTSI